MGMGSVGEKLAQWQTAQGFGKKPGTQKFHAEVVTIILRHWLDCDQAPESVTDQVLIDFAAKVAHYCPSRWNCIVLVLRSVTHRAACLKYRKLRFREFQPPDDLQWKRFLAECDRLPTSKAGLCARLLTLTGLRIAEARQLRWENVREDCIYVPGSISKNGLPRVIPFLPGLAAVLKTLRDAAGTRELVLPSPHFRNGLHRACERAGIKELSYHCFRHMFATRCIESGVDIPTVARWVGHQDGGALLSEMYFHLLDRHSREMAAIVKIAV